MRERDKPSQNNSIGKKTILYEEEENLNVIYIWQ